MAEAPPREPRDSYLDAARDCILDVGWRRTTLTEVARRAGVSRMTIYRTWGDMPQLLSDLMTREWAGVVTAQLPRFAGRPWDPRTPQNLAPVGALEAWLRHRMGDPRFIRRALTAWLAARSGGMEGLG